MSINNSHIKRSRRLYQILALIPVLLAFIFQPSVAQDYTEIHGQVFDDTNGHPIPFVNVYFKNTATGTTTDSLGNFHLKTSEEYNSLVISFVGYIEQNIPIRLREKQNLVINLKNQLVKLDELVFLSGENPAWAIIEKTVKNKKLHDKRSLSAYEYKSYNRIEFDIDNISTR